MSSRRSLPWILSALLSVGVAAQLSAMPEEVRETRDELDEEIGELGEETAEGATIGVGSREDFTTWTELVGAIATVAATGKDPLTDAGLVDRIRRSGDPRVFAAINNRMESSAHAFRQGAMVEILPITGAVFESLSSPKSSRATPPLKVGGSVLSGALFLLFGLRVVGQRRKAL